MPTPECLYLHDFESLEEARKVIGKFIERYNRGCLIERHGHKKSPVEICQQLTRMTA